MTTNDIRRSRTLTPHGVARVLALAANELFTEEAAKKTLRDLIEWLGEANVALGINDKPNASEWSLDIAEEIDMILENQS